MFKLKSLKIIYYSILVIIDKFYVEGQTNPNINVCK